MIPLIIPLAVGTTLAVAAAIFGITAEVVYNYWKKDERETFSMVAVRHLLALPLAIPILSCIIAMGG